LLDFLKQDSHDFCAHEATLKQLEAVASAL